jgi:hypothetical protein
MGTETTYKGKIEDWDRLHERLTANAAELAHLDAMRARLEAAMEQTRQVVALQAAQTAAKQEASKSLKESITEGDRLANLLRAAVKQHYGIRSEKLAEFGVQPFRGRNVTVKAKKAKAPQPADAPTPATTSQTPAE